jgi:hypothetical protein
MQEPTATENASDRTKPEQSPSLTRGSGGIDWKTRARIFGIPLIHAAFGTDENGELRVARGFIAVGHLGFGAITFAQFGVGVLFAFGQGVIGLFAVGQLAIGLAFATGQLAVGTIAVGQIVLGIYGMGQIGWATYLWSPGRTDMEAVALLSTIVLKIKQLLGMY